MSTPAPAGITAKFAMIFCLLCLAVSIGVLISARRVVSIDAGQKSPADIVLANIGQRKSVRAFLPDKTIEEDTLITLAKAAMAAPTARDKRPWQIYAINDRAKLDALAEGLPNGKMIQNCSAVMVVCGDMNLALEGNGRDYWIQDCSAATENLLLAAEALGLGAVWTGGYPAEDRVKAIQEKFALPETTIPLSLVVIVYPTGVEKPKDKLNPAQFHFN